MVVSELEFDNDAATVNAGILRLVRVSAIVESTIVPSFGLRRSVVEPKCWRAARAAFDKHTRDRLCMRMPVVATIRGEQVIGADQRIQESSARVLLAPVM